MGGRIRTRWERSGWRALKTGTRGAPVRRASAAGPAAVAAGTPKKSTKMPPVRAVSDSELAERDAAVARHQGPDGVAQERARTIEERVGEQPDETGGVPDEEAAEPPLDRFRRPELLLTRFSQGTFEGGRGS